MISVKDSIDKYKESGAVRKATEERLTVEAYKGGGHITYNGMRIHYQEDINYARARFTETFGDEVIIKDGEKLTGECCGHINLEVWDNEWYLEIETAHATVIELNHLNINILKKLSKFLNYAVDGLSSKEKK